MDTDPKLALAAQESKPILSLANFGEADAGGENQRHQNASPDLCPSKVGKLSTYGSMYRKPRLALVPQGAHLGAGAILRQATWDR